MATPSATGGYGNSRLLHGLRAGPQSGGMRRTVDLARLRVLERRDRVFDVARREDLIAEIEVLPVEDFLELTSDELPRYFPGHAHTPLVRRTTTTLSASLSPSSPIAPNVIRSSGGLVAPPYRAPRFVQVLQLSTRSTATPRQWQRCGRERTICWRSLRQRPVSTRVSRDQAIDWRADTRSVTGWVGPPLTALLTLTLATACSGGSSTRDDSSHEQSSIRVAITSTWSPAPDACGALVTPVVPGSAMSSLLAAATMAAHPCSPSGGARGRRAP